MRAASSPGFVGAGSGHSGVDGERGNHLALGPCQAEWPCPHHGCLWKPSGSLAWVSGWLLPHFISGAARPQVSGPRRCREGRPQDRDIGLQVSSGANPTAARGCLRNTSFLFKCLRLGGTRPVVQPFAHCLRGVGQRRLPAGPPVLPQRGPVAAARPKA